MELVYLWVEDYKNIKNQGFNFSPRFDCSYNEDTKELTINENKDYVHIFSENINVTAIVGENGSGKSSLINHFITKQKGFFVINENNNLKIYYTKISVQSGYEKTKLTNNFYLNTLFYSMDNTSHIKTNRNITHIEHEYINELIVRNFEIIQETEFNLFNFKPYYISFSLIDYWIPEEYDDYEKDIKKIQSILDYEEDIDRIRDTINALKDIDDLYLIYLFNRFETISEIFNYINLIEKIHPKNKYLQITYEDVQEILKKNNISFIDKEIYEKVTDFCNKTNKISDLAKIFGEDYINILFMYMSDELEFDFESESCLTLNSLSHGEKTLYSFYINLLNFREETIFLVLDEPDNTLHPNWQKKFINEIIQMCFELDIKVHVIINSHSPFIISDIPKENVIFLKNGKQEYPFKDNEQTFGANIHTLLSHGFFMEDGLMGEFAKEKINDVIKYLNSEESIIQSIKEAQNIINIIGEPVLKSTLQNMLNEKKYPNDSKLEKLKKEKERLEKEIKELEGKSDE